MNELTGRTLGRYRIFELIGKGGMGVVYRAHDERLGRNVAVKVLPDEFARDHDRLTRFEREARSIAKLAHPNILAIHDFGSEEGTAFAVTELLEGKTLRELIGGREMPIATVIELVEQIADGLEAAHAKGITHRDIKPENIMLTNDGHIKILDFGLAKRTISVCGASRSHGIDSTVEMHTMPGAIVGTLGYMSPEQASGGTIDYRTDIFALGCLIYEMVTGERAFGGTSPQEIMIAILEKEPPLLANIDRRINRVIHRCLEKQPAKRFQSTRDLVSALKAAPPNRESPATRASAVILAAASLAILIGLLVFLPPPGFWSRVFGEGDSTRIESIAVLPLANVSGETEQEIFADGMTDALITKLAQIGSIDVISRTSAMRYKNADLPLPEIAQQLGVDAVVEGSITCGATEIRIAVQLIDGASDRLLWTQSYQRTIGDVLFLQSEVAEAVADAIDAVLTPEERRRITRSRSLDPAVHEAYLMGTRQAMTFTNEGFELAIESYRRAIDFDPTWAVPHAALAMIYGNISFFSPVPPGDSFPLAAAAKQEAMKLDPDLGTAHMAGAWTAMVYGWDWTTAEAGFKRSIALVPASAEGHQLYSYLLSCTGRHDEAISEAQRATELDPLSPVIGQHLGMVLYLAGEHDHAIARLESITSLYPGFWFGYQRLAQARMATGDHQLAIMAAERAIELAGPDAFRSALPTLASLYAMTGRRDDALAILHELEETSKERYVPPTDLARIHIALGDLEAAIEDLERAVEVRDSDLFMLNVWPVFDPLRGDPRFDRLLDRIGFTGSAGS